MPAPPPPASDRPAPAPGHGLGTRGLPPALDETNGRILRLLGQQGRSTTHGIAEAVGRSESAVRERIAALEARGIVQGYEARIDWARVGLPVVAVVEGHCPPGMSRQLAEQLYKVPNLVSAMVTTGSPNVLAVVRARDMDDVHMTIAALASGVLRDIGVRLTVEGLVGERPPGLVPCFQERGPVHARAAPVVPRAGRGVAAVEAPEGLPGIST